MTLLNFGLAVAAGVLATECTDIAPWCAVRLARWAACRRYAGDPERAALRAAELESVLAMRPTRILKLTTALAFAADAVPTSTRWGVVIQTLAYIKNRPREYLVPQLWLLAPVMLGVIGVILLFDGDVPVGFAVLLAGMAPGALSLLVMDVMGASRRARELASSEAGES
ncbi:hypothetical protein [Actinomadura bangladeshensis]|uniref:Uncharacterized protein n=1 Tax=Actinomadura bangladeshensis TaxID=453573 RepID=A0A4R4PBK4_9ACTN|nr:hypothetical protein [Actinomadura bangladeshensis]TDC18383.1 hypothetical protein E1284_06575 [Actinomadura bangladeshensis]